MALEQAELLPQPKPVRVEIGFYARPRGTSLPWERRIRQFLKAKSFAEAITISDEALRRAAAREPAFHSGKLEYVHIIVDSRRHKLR